MNKFQEAFARLCLKPKAECDLPGRLRMKFSKYDMLPKEALLFHAIAARQCKCLDEPHPYNV